MLPVAPVPARETVCTPSGASSVIESVPLKLPVVPGAKITLMVQFAPEATLGVQVLDSLKFVVVLIPETLRDAVP